MRPLQVCVQVPDFLRRIAPTECARAVEAGNMQPVGERPIVDDSGYRARKAVRVSGTVFAFDDEPGTRRNLKQRWGIRMNDWCSKVECLDDR